MCSRAGQLGTLSVASDAESIAAVKLLVLAPTAVVLGLLLPASAHARPCSDTHPVLVDGKQWIVYTGDSARERRDIPCRKARRIARRYIRDRVAPPNWRCKHTLRVKRCVKGGTYVDQFGFERPRYLIGWHAAD